MARAVANLSPRLLISIFFLSLLPFGSWGSSSSSSIFQSFLQCLSNHSITAVSSSNPTSSSSSSPSSSSSSSSSILYMPNNPSFNSILQAYIQNRRFDTPSTPKPDLIITPYHESHISAAVICARTTGLQLTPRSGGHDYEGLSYTSDERPFAVLDMFNLRSIAVDIPAGTAWVQGGATLGELYYAIHSKSGVHAFPGGVCPTVGSSGHISGGGYGNLVRKYGLTVDHLLDAVVVDAGGRVLNRSTMGEDLFWAIGGGGASNFAIVVAFKIRLVSVPETVTVLRMRRTREETNNFTNLIYRYQLMANKTVDELFLRLDLEPAPSRGRRASKTIAATFFAMFLGNAGSLVGVVQRDLPELGLKREDCQEMTWIESVRFWAESDTPHPSSRLRTSGGLESFEKRKSDFLESPISADDLERLWRKMTQLGSTGIALSPFGGRVGRIAPSATPVPHRAGNIALIQYSIVWGEREGGERATAKNLREIRDLYSFMTPLVSKNPRRAFLNYRDLDLGARGGAGGGGGAYGRKYFALNYERLVKVKKMVDPHNVFRNEQSIPPAN